ncbi:MAG: hypothetical protein Q9183_003199 [Haloplaca sp. 2 TL-2023]
MVQRLAKGVLPPNTQIQKDAVTAMSKGATVFVSHIADKYVHFFFKSHPSLHCVKLRIRPVSPLHICSTSSTTTQNTHYFSLATSGSVALLLFLTPPEILPDVTNRANELTLSTSRKTISPKAVLDALRECEYADFLPRVEAELARFNEIATGKRNEYRRKIKEKETGGGFANAGGEGAEGGKGEKNVLMGVHVQQQNGEAGMEEEEGEERASKRMRTEDGLVDGSRVQVAGAPALQKGADTMVEEDDDDDAAEVEQQFEREEEVAEQEEDEEDEESDDEEESEDENGEAGSASGVDVDARMRAGRDGLSSGVDDGDSSEGSD